MISVGFGLDHKSPIVVNTEDVKQADLLVMWLLLLTPFNICGFCLLFVLDLPGSQQEKQMSLAILFSSPAENKGINSSAQVYLITLVTCCG